MAGLWAVGCAAHPARAHSTGAGNRELTQQGDCAAVSGLWPELKPTTAVRRLPPSPPSRGPSQAYLRIGYTYLYTWHTQEMLAKH